MMPSFVRLACASALVVACAAPAFAQRGGGGSPHPGPPAPVARPAPMMRAAPPPNAGGFNFNRDISPRPAPVAPPYVQPHSYAPPAHTFVQPPVAQPPRAFTPQRPVTPPQPVTPPRPNTAPQFGQNRPQFGAQPQFRGPNPAANVRRPPPNYRRAPFVPNVSGGPYHGRFTGPVVRNPHGPPGSWGWNHGVVWRPAPVYWGGGFWGPFALGALSSALLYGSIIDDQSQVFYPSYEVEADTPGAQLLQDYGLQQTPCGPPNLVVIWGPDNSVVCAFPDDAVPPGEYDIDPSTFSLVPASGP
jgi:hypothetical protein